MFRRLFAAVPFLASLSLSLASVGSAASLSACAGHGDSPTPITQPDPTDTDSQSIADDGTDTSAVEGDGVSLTGTLVSSSGSSLGLANVDTAGGDLSLDNVVGAGSKLFFAPLGCLTVSNPTTSSVAYTFNDCAGPRGLFKITGTVDVAYALASDNTLNLTITSSQLEVNGATIDWDVKASVTATGASRTMQWTGHLSGTTKGGRQITRDNTKTLTWVIGDSCFEINGTSVGTVGDRDIKTELVTYKRCKASCPEAGSEIKVTHVSANKTVDLVYGTGDATFTNAKGNTVTFVPLCAAL